MAWESAVLTGPQRNHDRMNLETIRPWTGRVQDGGNQLRVSSLHSELLDPLLLPLARAL